MSYLDDPRVYFAAERTLLAWVRTGIASIGLGFVIAKFGMFLEFFSPNQASTPEKSHLALGIGALLIIIGSSSCWLAALQFKWFCSTLQDKEIPPRHLVTFPWWFANCFALVALLLAAHLLI